MVVELHFFVWNMPKIKILWGQNWGRTKNEAIIQE
jgi:hypothetical protein